MRYPRIAAIISAAVVGAPAVVHAAPRTFDPGSLIIPMDLTYQDHGMFQAYGLIFQLLQHGVKVAWVIDPAKTWHAADCDTVGDVCPWDCEEEGQGDKCPYPTASPDFFAAAQVVWDGEGLRAPGTPIVNHGYRGGPFVIDAADHDAAMAVIDAWNDQSMWAANPWAQRTLFDVVSVHQATASFTGDVAKDMLAAPTIAVFSDGNEDIATSYLRAAGIPQSNGSEFPAAKCGAVGTCGPGTPNPDMLTVPSVAGDMGTCSAPSNDHENGALFTADGLPAYCQIMSMHWAVTDRETVQCNGGGCPATQAACGDEPITYHGHEVVAEVRSFLNYPVHFFAECQAVNAYENTVPNPAWPYLDDDGRIGHFLTTQGMPPACPCTETGFTCVTGGCGGADCCLPTDIKEQGAGFLIAAAPADQDVQVLRPNVAYNQFDGRFSTIGGSEPAYNLSDYLMTEYINMREVTLLTGPNGPGDQDVWMTGYANGECDIGGGDDVGGPAGTCAGGKVSYLGGHDYNPGVPLSARPDSQGTRMFLNALFEADCVTTAGQPLFDLSLLGDLVIGAQGFPVEGTYMVGYHNTTAGPALDSILDIAVPGPMVEVTDAPGGTIAGQGASWDVGSISGDPAQVGDPPSAGSRPTILSFAQQGDYDVTIGIGYRVGASRFSATRTFTIHVGLDTDGDGVPDDVDADPLNPNVCGDSDMDTCDDCSQGMGSDPANDGTDTDGDGICDAGETGGGGGGDGDSSGCGCRAASDVGGSFAGLVFAAGVALLIIRRRRSRGSGSARGRR